MHYALFIILAFMPIKLLMPKETWGPVGHFSKTYFEARKVFLQEIWNLQKQKLKVEHSELELRSSGLFADALYVAPMGRPKKLLILSSGIHGAEAPLGSALQIEFLKKVFPKLNRQNLGILMFHSLNPEGYNSKRRVTQNNIDLNRNFLFSPDAFKNQVNASYEKHQQIISKKTRVANYFFNAFHVAANFLRIALRGSMAKQELTQAFAGGQYVDPQGIYYGGARYEPQVEWVARLLEKTLVPYEEILLYDIHSGLGKASELQMIASLETKLHSEHVLALREKLDKVNALSFVSPVSEGFYITSGDFIDFVYEKAPKQARVAAFTAEFGTLGDSTLAQLKTSQRIILENQGAHFGYASKALEQTVKHKFSELFNPQNSKWRESVLKIGLEAFEATLAEELSSQILEKAE